LANGSYPTLKPPAPPNNAPTGLALSAATVAENESAGTVVGTFSTTDDDTGDTHTYTLISGTGDTDNASFTIDGDSLKTAAVFDYETQSSYSIRVKTDDGNGGTFQQAFTITVTDDTSDNPQVVTYGWENGGVHLGKSGNLKSAANVGVENGVTPRDGSAMLSLTGDSVSGNAPEAYLVWVAGLTEGDQVTASFWVHGQSDNGVNSSGRVWGGYTSASQISSQSKGSASGNSAYGGGNAEWEQISHTWTVAADKEALNIKARVYAGSATTETIYIDDLQVTVSNPNATVTLPPANAAPVANAGQAQTVNEGATVTLDGSDSTDADGDNLTYTWSGPHGITLTGHDTVSANFTAPDVDVATDYTLALEVSDGAAVSSKSFITVTVNNVASAGPVMYGATSDHSVKLEFEALSYSDTATYGDPSGNVGKTWIIHHDGTDKTGLTVEDGFTFPPQYGTPKQGGLNFPAVNFTIEWNGEKDGAGTNYILEGSNLQTLIDSGVGATASGNVMGDLPNYTTIGTYTIKVVDIVAPADTTAPDAPTLTGVSPTTNITPTLTGTAEAGSTVNILLAGSSVGQDQADGNGDYSITVSALSVGSHDLTAKATDAVGNESQPSDTFTIVVETLPQPTLNFARNSAITTGDGSANSPLEVEEGDDVLLGTLTVQNPAANVNYFFNTTASGIFRNDGSFEIDLVYNPQVNILEVGLFADPGTANDFNDDLALSVFVKVREKPAPADTVKPVITLGQAGPITVTVGGSLTLPAATATDNVDGDISNDVVVDDSDVDINQAGTYTVTYDVDDDAGNSADTVQLVVKVEAVALPVYTITVNQTSGGSVSPENDVTVLEGGNAQFTITPDAGYEISDVSVDNVSQGAITSYTFSSVDADHSINVTFAGVVADADGDGEPDSTDAFPNDANETADSDSDGVGDNADAFPNDPNETTDADNDGVGANADLDDNDASVGTQPSDNTPPAKPTLTGPSVTNNSTPTLSGTAEAGSTVSVILGNTSLGQVTADSNGDYSVTVSELSEGSHDITATATDAANNVSQSSDALTVEVDLTAPNTPSISFTTPTTDTTPEFSGTAEAGSTVTILVGGNEIGQATADGNGDYDFTPSSALALGTHAVAVKATDEAGNIGSTSSDQSLVVEQSNVLGTTVVQYPYVPMTILAKLSHQGYTGAAGDTVKAYVGNELRAKGTVQIEAGVPVVGLLVNVNAAVSGGESLSTVLVEDDNGGTFNFVNKTKLVSGSTIGNNGRYLLTDGVSQTLSFVEGWNFVSMYVRRGNDSAMTPTAYFGDNYSKVQEIRTYSGVYNPSDPLNGVLSTLNHFELGEGYWVRSSHAFDNSVSGFLGGDLTVELDAGWNMAGYPRRERRTVADVIGTLKSAGKLVQVISDTELYLADDNLSHFNTLSHFDPGKGYWLKMSDSASWDLNFPELVGGSGQNNRGVTKSDASAKLKQLQKQLVTYPSVPAIVLADVSGVADIPEGSLVGAFVGDELRGVQATRRVGDRNTVALVVHAQQKQTVQYRLWDAKSREWQNIIENHVLDSGDVLGMSTRLAKLTVEANSLAKGLVLSRDDMRLVVAPELRLTHKLQRSVDLIHWEDLELDPDANGTGLEVDASRPKEFFRLIKR